ncbi:MAG: LTA synthase family protein [bacterium]|nr:LTA synthase family protein [bacterium]
MKGRIAESIQVRRNQRRRGSDTGSEQLSAANIKVSVLLWVIPVLAAVVLPGLKWVVEEGPMAPRYSLVVAMAAISSLIAVTLLATLSRWFKYRVRWSMSVTATIVLVLFNWLPLTRAGEIVAEALRVSLLSDVVAVVLAIGVLWIAVRLGGEWQFAAILGATLLIACGVLFIDTQSRVPNEPNSSRAEAATPGSPDVLLLILDGYARADVLDSRFGYDNSPFITELETLGFNVADEAHSNYGVTYAALSSMFELDYVFDLGTIGPSEHEAMRNALSGDPELFRSFHEQGYEIAYTENSWAGSSCSGSVDLCWSDGLFDTTAWVLSRMTIFAPLVAPIQPHPFSTVSFDHLDALPEIVGSQRTEGVPRLTIAHIVLPHPPLLLDTDCNRHTGTAREELSVSDPNNIVPRLGYYVEQVQCTNRMVIDALAEIFAERADTLVMITGDHGTDSKRVNGISTAWTDPEMIERMSILSAYRLPGCADVSETISPVNGARALANCALDADLRPMPDRFFWAPGSIKGTVIDVEHLLSE